MADDHYKVLGVGPESSAAEIRKAFRAKARKYHPDKQPPGTPDAQIQRAKQEFQRVAAAFEILGNEKKRKSYDVGRSNSSSKSGVAGAAPRNSKSKRGWQEPDEEELRKRREYDLAAYHERKKKQDEEKERKKAEDLRVVEELGVKLPPASVHARVGQDDDSDASSVLSFDVGLDRNRFNFDDLDLDDLKLGKDCHAHGEVWNLQKPPSEKTIEVPAPAAAAPAAPAGRRSGEAVTAGGAGVREEKAKKPGLLSRLSSSLRRSTSRSSRSSG